MHTATISQRRPMLPVVSLLIAASAAGLASVAIATADVSRIVTSTQPEVVRAPADDTDTPSRAMSVEQVVDATPGDCGVQQPAVAVPLGGRGGRTVCAACHSRGIWLSTLPAQRRRLAARRRDAAWRSLELADGLISMKAENWVAICPSSRLTSQTIICVRLDTMDFLLIREGDQVFACERACPHEQADLSLGHVADGRLFCPRHLASFDLQDGNISAGWASKPLRIFPARIKDEQIWIDTAAIAR